MLTGKNRKNKTKKDSSCKNNSTIPSEIPKRANNSKTFSPTNGKAVQVTFTRMTRSKGGNVVIHAAEIDIVQRSQGQTDSSLCIPGECEGNVAQKGQKEEPPPMSSSHPLKTINTQPISQACTQLPAGERNQSSLNGHSTQPPPGERTQICLNGNP